MPNRLVDLDLELNDNFKMDTVDGDLTLTASNINKVSQMGVTGLKIDGTGGYTITLDPTYFQAFNDAVALDSTAGAYNLISWIVEDGKLVYKTQKVI